MYHDIGLFLTHISCYWIMVYIYDNKHQSDFKSGVFNSIKNQIFVTYPIINIIFRYYPINYYNFTFSLGYIPILIVIGDIYFYLSHRPLHSKLLWRFHKTHHRGMACCAKSLDADILEHLFGNIGSFVIGIFILYYFKIVINIYIVYGWTAVATINTCICHSAGKSKYDNKIHEVHHKYLKYNYGTGFYIMDRLFNSYKNNID
jgi:sterol desaturase/sphingolipid hydroxylase (fatty acid hydroxylase superfamily)